MDAFTSGRTKFGFRGFLAAHMRRVKIFAQPGIDTKLFRSNIYENRIPILPSLSAAIADAKNKIITEKLVKR